MKLTSSKLRKIGGTQLKNTGVAWNKPLRSFSDSILDKEENDVQ